MNELTPNSLAQLADQLHDTAELVWANYNRVAHQARTMGRGYPSGGVGAIGSSEASSVERMAMSDAVDPGAEAGKLLAEIIEWKSMAIVVERKIRKQTGAINKERENTVPQCLICEGPAVPCRRGLCDSCRQAHKRAGWPDIRQFTVERRAKLRPAG